MERKKRRISLPSFQLTVITGSRFYFLPYIHIHIVPFNVLLSFCIDWDSDILQGIQKSIQGIFNSAGRISESLQW